MNLQQKNQFVLLFFLLISCGSCQDKAALKQMLIEKMVYEKVETHKRKRIATCNQLALEEAINLADSMMIKAALSQIDTSNRVVKPTKPVRPEINLVMDTTAIRPLFEDSLLERE